MDGGTASETAGDWRLDAIDSSRAWPDTDATEDSNGLCADTEGCVRLGDDEAWSCEDGAVDIDIEERDVIVPFEALDTGGAGILDVGVLAVSADGVEDDADDDTVAEFVATAAAAAAAY